MKITKENLNCPKIAGVLFAILAVGQLINVILAIKSGGSFLGIVNMISYGLLAFSLITERKDKVLQIGFAIFAAMALIEFFAGFSTGDYTHFRWSYYSGARESFNFFFMLPALIKMVGKVGTVLVIFVLKTPKMEKYQAIAKKCWFVAPAVIAASYVIALFIYIIASFTMIGFWVRAASFVGVAALIKTILLTVAMGMVMYWIAEPELKITSASNAAEATVVTEDEGYIKLINHVLLLLFTCGIWMYIWIYKTTNYLNRVEGEEYRNPTTKLLLCMFVPFYFIYWTYISAQRIDKYAKASGVSSDLTTICLILAIFVSFIPPILMQEKFNQIVTANGAAPVQQEAEAVTPQPEIKVVKETVRKTDDEVAEALKKYKALLDEGILTQEEFDAKKKQLLDL